MSSYLEPHNQSTPVSSGPSYLGGAGFHSYLLRNQAKYDSFALALAPIVRGARVLDIGAGTGVISLIASFLGARTVRAVERGRVATVMACLHTHTGPGQLTFDNIDFMSAPPPSVRFDVVIAELVGYLGVEEGFLPVANAVRRRWLTERGVMLPSAISLTALPVAASRSDSNTAARLACRVPTAPVRHRFQFSHRSTTDGDIRLLRTRGSWTFERATAVQSVKLSARASLSRTIHLQTGLASWPACVIALPDELRVSAGDCVDYTIDARASGSLTLSLKCARQTFAPQRLVNTWHALAVDSSFYSDDVSDDTLARRAYTVACRAVARVHRERGIPVCLP